jgi:hypothetical protein
MPTKMNDKEKLLEILELFSNPYYDSFRPYIKKLLRLSRNKEFMSIPTNHLSLQLVILKALEEGDIAVSVGRKMVAIDGKGQEIQNKRNQTVSLAFRLIADGIAWRTLQFNRFHIRVLSQAHSPGPVNDKAGRIAEELQAKKVAEQLGHFVLFNDVTNILRVGDLVFINPDTKPQRPAIAEMKKKKMILFTSVGRKIDNNQALNKQEIRLLQAQSAILTNTFSVDGRKAPVLNINPVSIKDKLNKVNKMIVQANKSGSCEGYLTPYMYFCALDLTCFKHGDLEGLKNAESTKAPQDLTPIAFWSSYDTIGIYEKDILRSTAPFTVYPFSTDNIIKLIFGELSTQVIIYRDPLVKAFKELGWELKINDSALDKYNQELDQNRTKYFSSYRLFPKGGFQEGDYMMLVNPKNGFKWPIFNMVTQMTQEYTTVEYVVSQVEQIMNAAVPGKVNGFYLENTRDAERWN